MAFKAERWSAGMGSFLFTHSSRCRFAARLNSGVRDQPSFRGKSTASQRGVRNMRIARLLLSLSFAALLAACGGSKLDDKQLIGTWTVTDFELPESTKSKIFGQLPENTRGWAKVDVELKIFNDGRFSEFKTVKIGSIAERQAVAWLTDIRYRHEGHGNWKVSGNDLILDVDSGGRVVAVSDQAKKAFENNPNLSTSFGRGMRGRFQGKVSGLSASGFTWESSDGALVFQRAN